MKRLILLLTTFAVVASSLPGLGVVVPPEEVDLAVHVLSAEAERPDPHDLPDLVAHGRLTDDDGLLTVALEPVDARALEALTAAHVGERVALVVDDVWLASPVVREAIHGDQLQIDLR